MAKKRTKKTPTEPQVDATQEPTELSPKSKEWNEGVAAGITEEDRAEIFVDGETGEVVPTPELSDDHETVDEEEHQKRVAAAAAKKQELEEALIAEAQEELDSLVTPVPGGSVASQEVTGEGFSSKKTSESATNAARRNVNNAREKVDTPKYRMNVNGNNSGDYASSSIKTKVNSNRSGVFKIRDDEPINNAKGTHRE